MESKLIQLLKGELLTKPSRQQKNRDECLLRLVNEYWNDKIVSFLDGVASNLNNLI